MRITHLIGLAGFFLITCLIPIKSQAAQCIQNGGALPCYTPRYVYVGSAYHGDYVTRLYATKEGAENDLAAAASAGTIPNTDTACLPSTGLPRRNCNYGVLRSRAADWWDSAVDICDTNECGPGGVTSTRTTYSGPEFRPQSVNESVIAWGYGGPILVSSNPEKYKQYYTFSTVGTVTRKPICNVGDSNILETGAGNNYYYACVHPTGNSNHLNPPSSSLDVPTEGKLCSCDPVDLTTGLKVEHVVDYQGHSPYPIIFDRFYQIGGLWHIGYDRRVEIGMPRADGTRDALLTRDNGSYIHFIGVDDGQGNYTWTTSIDPQVMSRLSTTASNGTITGFTIKNARDESEAYDQDGRLTKIQNKEGYALYFTYDDRGRLSLIEDDFGDNLDVHYPSLQEIASFTVLDPTSPDGMGTSTSTQHYWNQKTDSRAEYLPDEITNDHYTVVYNYGNTEVNGQAQTLLTDVGQNDGSVKSYIYGEKLALVVTNGTASTQVAAGNGTSSEPTSYAKPFDLTGVINEDGNRYETIFYQSVYYSQVTGETLGETLKPLRFSGIGGERDVTDKYFYVYHSSSPNNKQITGQNSASSRCPAIFCQGPLADWKSTTYDSSNHVSGLTDFLGNKQDRSYDLVRGVPLSITEASNKPDIFRTTTYTWDARFREPTTITEPILVNGTAGTRTTTIDYDDQAHPLFRTISTSTGEPARTWTYTYDSFGLPATVTSPTSAVTNTHYDDKGLITGWTDADGHSTTVDAYTPRRLPGRITDPNGLQTLYTYDLRDRVTQIQRGSSAPGSHWETVQITFQPSGTGLVDHLVLTDGRQVAFTYNSAQWLMTATLKDTTGATLGSIVYSYTIMGEPNGEQWQDAGGNTITTGTVTYDAFHRLSTTVGASSQTSTLTYDAQSQPLTAKDPNGNLVKKTYDALGRVITVTDALNHTATLAYDPQDAVTQATDFNGHTTTYSYNGFGDLISRSSPDTGTWTFSVDGGGRTIGVTDARGATTAITYDSNDRPTHIVYDDTALPPGTGGAVLGTETQTFTYDTCAHGIGHLCEMTDASGTTDYTYDLWGRVTGTAFTPTGLTSALTVSYGYDTAGRLTTLTYPSGKVVTQAYGSDGELSSLNLDGALVLNAVTHRPVGGEVTGWAWGSVAAGNVSFSFDSDSQLTNITDNAVQGTSRTLGYDPGGRLTSVTVAGHPSWNQIYGYDKNDHLTSATLGGYPGGLAYGYDLNGNRTTGSNDGTGYSLTTSPTSNRLTAVTPPGGTSTSLTYDANGNLISDGLLALAYDAKNRLTTADGGAGGVTYTYNAQGLRMAKQVIGGPLTGIERYVYGPGGELLGVYDASGNVIEETLYLDDGRPVALSRAGTTYPILTDQLGTPRQILDPVAGTPVWTWEAKEPFGSELPNQTVSGTTFTYRGRFPGQVFDPDTGLVHNGFRDYLSSVGRYVESDPIGLAGGWNTYGYVGGSPLDLIDKYGLSGVLTINSRSVNWTGGLLGHSWIGYKKDNGSYKTYGTWGNNPLNNGNGLMVNIEASRNYKPDASRSIHINDEQEINLFKKIKEYALKRNNGWSASAPCSTFAADAWEAATNETLNVNGFGFGFMYSNPASLTESIMQANKNEH